MRSLFWAAQLALVLSCTADSPHHRILEIEDQRRHDDPYLLQALQSTDSELIRLALTAIGRMGDPNAVESISPFLGKVSPELRKSAAFALGLIASNSAHKVLVNRLQEETNAKVRGEILKNIGRSGTADTLVLLHTELTKTLPPAELAGAAHGLGLLFTWRNVNSGVSTPLLNRLVELSKFPSPVGTSAAFALSRYRGDLTGLSANTAVKAARVTLDPNARILLCRTLGKLEDPSADALLLKYVDDPLHPLLLRVEATRALKRPSEEAFQVYRGILDRESYPQLTEQVLRTVATYGAKASVLSDPISNLFEKTASQATRRSALKTLAQIDLARAQTFINSLLESREKKKVITAVKAIGASDLNSDLLNLLKNAAQSEDMKIKVAVAEAHQNLTTELIGEEVLSVLRTLLATRDEGIIYHITELVKKLELRVLLPEVSQLLTMDLAAESAVAAIQALEKIGGQGELTLLSKKLESPVKQVVEAAVSAWKTITGEDLSHLIPLNSKVTNPTPSYAEIERAVQAKVILKTTKGIIRMKMLPEAPLTATHFVRLVESGFYNGLTFHRVVPNFVIQGGDPRGDGFGGPDFVIRDEVSRLIHKRGSVGIATAGKDTGGSQIFVNHGPNLHLDGVYTNFASVTWGIHVVDKIEVGDKILEAFLAP